MLLQRWHPSKEKALQSYLFKRMDLSLFLNLLQPEQEYEGSVRQHFGRSRQVLVVAQGQWRHVGSLVDSFWAPPQKAETRLEVEVLWQPNEGYSQ